MKGSAHQAAKGVRSLVPQVATADGNGVAVDCIGYREALVVCDIGVLTGTSIVFELEESADGSTGWTDISGGNTATITTGEDDAIYVLRVDLTKRLRYLRVVANVTGAGNYPLSATVILLQPRSLPVTQANTAVSV